MGRYTKVKFGKEGTVMGRMTFRGGIQTDDGKVLSKNNPIAVLFPKGDAVFPLSQHIGLPARPVVAVGDKVLVGQRLAEANGVVSAHVISAVSGRVKAIEERPTVSGAMCESIVIENDGAFATAEGIGTKRDYTTLSKEEIRQYIKDAGIVGLGGTGFPTHVKLTPKKDDAIEYVIVNGTECEPYLTADDRLMREEGKKIVDGLKVMLRLFENAKGRIVVTEEKKEAIRKLSGLIKREERIELQVVKAKYPQGAERKVIQVVTGRKMTSSMIPVDIGCIVHNVETVAAVYRAVAESIPFIRRVMTVSGDGVKEPQNVLVCLGTSFQELLQLAGGAKGEPELYVAGGPMRGMRLTDLSVPVTKTVSALTVFAKNKVTAMPVSPCIRCGRCISVCPSGLVPRTLIKYAEASDKEGFVKRNGMECMECGCCSYVCPAGSPLMQNFKQLRRSILDDRRKR